MGPGIMVSWGALGSETVGVTSLKLMNMVLLVM